MAPSLSKEFITDSSDGLDSDDNQPQLKGKKAISKEVKNEKPRKGDKSGKSKRLERESNNGKVRDVKSGKKKENDKSERLKNNKSERKQENKSEKPKGLQKEVKRENSREDKSLKSKKEQGKIEKSKKALPTKKAPPSESSQSSSSSEDSSSDDSSSDDTSKRLERKNNSGKSRDDDKSEKSKKSPAIQKAPAPESSQSSSESDDSSSDETSSDESSSEDEPQQQVPAPSSQEKKSDKGPSIDPASVPIPEFIPPKGFKPSNLSAPSSDILNAFSDLRGKELWHIKAPYSSQPEVFDNLSIPILKLNTTIPIAKHKDVYYTLSDMKRSQVNREEKLLAPGKDGDVYHHVPHKFSRHLRLKELFDYRLRDAEEFIRRRPKKKPPPKSPKGLRMRYRPYPSDGGPQPPIDLGWGSESEAGEATFKVPRGGSLEKEGKKRKHSEVSESTQSRGGGPQANGAELPRKKSKKLHTSQNGEKLESHHKTTSSKSAGKEESTTGKFSLKGDKSSEDTKRQRKALKEEKKQKKQEKLEKRVEREKQEKLEKRREKKRKTKA